MGRSISLNQLSLVYMIHMQNLTTQPLGEIAFIILVMCFS